MKLKGRVLKYGDNVDTDVIIPARYLNTSNPDELARHCMEDIDPDFASKVKDGDIIVAGKNFGSGSSREHAPLAIKSAGVSCVIAESFARIFYRNAINIGLPILECKDVTDRIEEGDLVEVDLNEGKIKLPEKNINIDSTPFPSFMQEIIKAGGLIEKIKGGIKHA
ncbi:3-isopropylmalate dehydratase small subunit [Halothermothrix orenii]|uniref:3-isopropylmalate dehydratase small subunit n=1 Tax=Halothermothrix orenii (strain H 168 / OCM 544 / DSM 9562) TaxID=373903 RepID=LEUD_HALOH|nr:3-isopropylmalate dehydratase small subunit [Halothermothrix orenii]B8CX23.1 RecName: Full=3-isopropylmalate dehydratase small subunit; AltName: Full=Alpha-IPM isomerase; Short=IPMI; AltName: Full=Isopropylmalate isomerase [Halothermothrix orenii H 168]ACL69842.1 3-isopropylmalate dehydratase, small subunit [Halothermothrix orenii H 168]